MAWNISGSTKHVAVHSNSGEFTYGRHLCGGTPNSCEPYAKESVNAYLGNDKANFPEYDSQEDPIQKIFDAKSCNQDMLVMWFQSGRTSYNILDVNYIFDIKNVDECRHIIFSEKKDDTPSGSTYLRVKTQTFEKDSYVDSGYPYISVDPCVDIKTQKYESGTNYGGHKIKYHTISDTIPDDFYKNHDELVELYFPHMYKEDDDEGINTKIIGKRAFSNSINLNAITMGCVEEIHERAFSGCTNLKTIDWGHHTNSSSACCDSQLKIIEKEAFFSCNEVEKLCLENLTNIENIGESAFTNCIKCSYLTLPSSSAYSTISESCFKNLGSGTSGITEVVIPGNINSIKTKAFENSYITKLDLRHFIRKSHNFTNIEDEALSINFGVNTSGNVIDIRDAGLSEDVIKNNLIRILGRKNSGSTITFKVMGYNIADELTQYFQNVKGYSGWTFTNNILA